MRCVCGVVCGSSALSPVVSYVVCRMSYVVSSPLSSAVSSAVLSALSCVVSSALPYVVSSAVSSVVSSAVSANLTILYPKTCVTDNNYI